MKDFLQAVVYTSAFLVLFTPLMITDSMFFPFITGKNFAFRILVEVALVGWVLLAFFDRSYRPRFSWIMVSGGALLIVMFFANFFGEYPLKSFWSNYERMEGYVTLVHFYLYFLVLGNILRTPKMWSYFFHTSVAVAGYVALYGLGQSTGVIEGRNRVDSTLGNAAYMAVYMLFHAFIVFFLALRSKTLIIRGLYGLALILFVYILLETGTRGTFIGLVGGSGVAIVYMALFGRSYPEIRKAAIGGFIALVAFVGVFLAFKDSQFIQNNVALGRIANISSEDLTTRMTIWSMAWKGVEERPLLGWGQGNFNYVFNENYQPSLYGGEQWFDRVHNIVFDWLIAGGILGFIAYISIFVSAVYYLFFRPLFYHGENNNDTSFTVLERAVLLGLLAGYFAHNLVVFDNIVSYIFFAAILALIHSRVSTEIPAVAGFSINRQLVSNIVTPVLVVGLAAVIYFVHVPGLLAAQDIIDAFRSQDPNNRFAAFEQALHRGSFANQEIVEQLAQQAMNLARQPNIPNEIKEEHLRFAEQQLQTMVEQKPNDARLHVFFSSFYRSIGQFQLAKEHIDIARSLSPDKQTIILEQGIVSMMLKDYDAMVQYFETAFKLDERFRHARMLYGAALLYTDRADEVRGLVGEELFTRFALTDMALQAANQNNHQELLADMFRARIDARPQNAQNYASLAFLHYQAEQIDEAIAILQEGVAKAPSFATVGQCYISNLEAGNKPDEGC